jgi:hypothetical protein
MKSKTLFAIVIVCLMLCPAALAQTAFHFDLSGATEVPGPGDPDGIGAGVVIINGTEVSYEMFVANIGAPTAAHIHRGATGIAGPIVVDLMPSFANGVARGTVSASAAIIAEILATPRNFYVNVHNAEFPAGAVRGQLATETLTFHALMTGEAEVPGPGAPGATGLGLVRFDGMNVHFRLATDGVNMPGMAHIHRGGADVAGPIVVDFASTFVNGFATGTVTATQDVINEILANPGDFYINIHNAEFPAGAVRGQLVASTEDAIYIPVVGDVRGGAGSNYLTDVRIVNRGGFDETVNIEFFAASQSALEGPTAIRTVTVAAGEQAVLDNLIGGTFGATGLGALRIVGSGALRADARVINDQRAAGAGTTGFSIAGRRLDQARTDGVLPFLSSAAVADINAGLGFRTNVGLFNPNRADVLLTLNARRTSDGTPFASTVVIVPALSMQQRAVFDWLTNAAVADRVQDDYYITWSASAPLFVYATINDNRTNDGVFVE